MVYRGHRWRRAAPRQTEVQKLCGDVCIGVALGEDAKRRLRIQSREPAPPAALVVLVAVPTVPTELKKAARKAARFDAVFHQDDGRLASPAIERPRHGAAVRRGHRRGEASRACRRPYHAEAGAVPHVQVFPPHCTTVTSMTC
ncbi:unnamed protein product [Symbiodinium natans]|uniref:Uncharacterized protein n=1 Tax=Symbiodinium natans TaxID=878477 RepID=A0A812I7N2_9DINO|nr:unnamed protein product [Symbiodinium natans]